MIALGHTPIPADPCSGRELQSFSGEMQKAELGAGKSGFVNYSVQLRALS